MAERFIPFLFHVIVSLSLSKIVSLSLSKTRTCCYVGKLFDKFTMTVLQLPI
jgi:hypothetical protein